MRLSNDAIPPRAKASWLPCYGSVRYSQYPYKCYQFRILLDEHLSLRYRDDKPRFNVIKELGANTYLSVFPIMTIDPFDVRKYTIQQLEQKIKLYLLLS